MVYSFTTIYFFFAFNLSLIAFFVEDSKTTASTTTATATATPTMKTFYVSCLIACLGGSQLKTAANVLRKDQELHNDIVKASAIDTTNGHTVNMNSISFHSAER